MPHSGSRSHGIFTIASGWTRAGNKKGVAGDESFEAFAEAVAPGKLAEADAAVGSSKVRRGRWLAEEVTCPAEVEDLYRDVLDALERRGMPGVKPIGMQS